MGYFPFRKKPRICRPEMILDALEERIVLDATVDQAPQDNQDSPAQNSAQAQTLENAGQTGQGATGPGQAAAPTAATSAAEQVFNQDLNVVLISNALDQVEAISQATADNATVIVYDSNSDNLDTISAKLDSLVQSSGQKIGALAVVDHATDGLIQIGTDNISSGNLFKFVSTLEYLAADLSENAQIQFYGCSIAGDASGKSLVDQIALYTTADIFASSDNTGGTGNNWTLEFASADAVALTQLFDSGELPNDGSELVFYDPRVTPTPPVYPGGAYAPPLDNLSTCYQYYSALDDQDQITVHPTWSASYAETWHFVLTEATTVSIGMQTVHPELTHGQAGFIDCAIDLYPSTSEYGEPDPATRITQNDDWGTPGDRTHAPYYSGNDAIIYNYSLNAGTYAIQATHWSDPINQPLYNWQTGGYYLLSNVELAYWTHNHPNAPASDGVPNPPTQPEDFSPSYQYDTGQFFSDPQSTALTYQFGTITFNGLTLGGGTPTIDPNTGVVTFTSSPNSSGYVTMQVRAFDGELYSQYHTFIFTVCPEREWFTDSTRVVATSGGGAADVWVVGHDTSLPADSAVRFTVDADYSVEYGSLLSLTATDVYHDADGTYHGRFVYTPDAGYYGEDAFQFRFEVQRGAWNAYANGSSYSSVGGNTTTYSVQMGDLDNDGDLDIVQGNYGQASGYYLNNGAGNFGAITTFGAANNTVSIQLGDVNHDGWLDIVQGNTGNQSDMVYLNLGYADSPLTGRQWEGFDTARAITGSNTGTRTAIALGDLDRDGDLDLVSGLNDTAAYYDRIFFNDGMGVFTFQANVTDKNRYTGSLALGDLNDDGYLDLVVGKLSGNANGDVFYLNNGAGGFGTGTYLPFPAGVDNTTCVKIGDMDNDGDLDIVTGNYATTGTANAIKLYLNSGTGTFATQAAIGSTRASYGIDLGDLDRDGDLDIVQGIYNNRSRYYLNNGAGGFPTIATFGGSLNARPVEIGDVNGDGILDVLQGISGASDRLYINGGFPTGTTFHPLDPTDVRINVTLMTNPSFESNYSGWTMASIPGNDAFSTFSTVPNKQLVNDLAPIYDYYSLRDELQLAFGLPWKVTDNTADKTEDIAVLLGTSDSHHAILYQDVTLPANAGLTGMELHWLVQYQNEWGWLYPGAAFDANQFLAVHVYDPNQPATRVDWSTQTNQNPNSVDTMQEFWVSLPAGLVPTGSAKTVRVEVEVMAWNWFFEVAVDDFCFVPFPPGAVTAGPIYTESPTMQLASAPLSEQSFSSFSALILWPDNDVSDVIPADSTIVTSSTVDPNSLSLLKILETASQTQEPPLTTVSVLASATGATETLGASSGEPTGGEPAGATSQPVSPTSQPASTVTTSEPVTTTSEPTSVDSGTPPAAPTSTDVVPAIAPEPITVPSAGLDVSYWLAAASDSVDATGDAPAVQDLTMDPATALAFNLEDVSAWDVLKSSSANVVDPQVDPGLRNLAARLAAGEAFSVDLDSISLTRIFG